MIAVHASSTVVTVAARASLTAMTGDRAVMMVTDRAMIAVHASSTVMTVAARASLTAMTGARGVMMATARVARAALIAAIATSRSVRRPRRIVDAQRCSSAKVAVSTAKIIRVRLAVMTSGRSLTRAQCVDRESVMLAATSGAQPTSALAINVPPIAVTAMIGERGDISFLHLVHSKNN
jgi:hypothetical protein